ncbi:DUF1269 domain-containing protein [Rubripirellula obstinata]|nr:DUF1269 domain-containing protein [Rubripirellula obstinata]
MSNECLIAEFTDPSSLETALEVLHRADYERDSYSVVTSANQVDDTVLADAKDKTPASPPAEKTMGASTLVGGTLGGVLGTSTMIGPMLVAGPLAGMAAGAAGGSLLAAVESWGVRKDVGDQYENRVAGGASLIIVNGDEMKLSNAERMLQTCDPESLERFTQ